MPAPFPGMPAMPSIPNISAGGGGPSSARSGDTGSFGGFDGSGWMLNFGGTQVGGADQAGALAGVGYRRDRYGLPAPVGVGALPMGNPILRANTGTAGIFATSSGGGPNLPLILGAVVVAVLLMRR